LQNIQKLREDEAFGGGRSKAEDDFGALDDDKDSSDTGYESSSGGGLLDDY
jgi:hypothetical protein